MGRKKRRTPGLGRALAKKSGASSPGNGGGTQAQDQGRHGGVGERQSGLISVLEASDLAELMMNAELAGQDFHTEGGREATLKTGAVVVGQIDEGSEEKRRKSSARLNEAVLRIPRRPKWEGLGKEELEKAERRSFLDWRRCVAEVWRQLWRVLERSDVVVQIVDARNPLLYYCADLKKYTEDELGRNMVLLVNKADLLSSKMISTWLSYFQLKNIDTLFFSAFDASIHEKAQDQRVLSAEELLRKLSSYPKTVPRIASAASERLVVGMVGYPNVGKSSTINVLLELAYSEKTSQTLSSISVGRPTVVRRVAESETPGRTKHFQTHHLNGQVTLCDCPGLVFPNFSTSKAELITSGILPIDQMRGDPVTPVDLVAQRIPRAIFEDMYGILFSSDGSQFISGRTLLETHARARGFMSDHDKPDISRSARQILKDYVQGRLLFSHPPPPAPTSMGDSGVGPTVLAKKGKLIRRKREVQQEMAKQPKSDDAKPNRLVQPEIVDARSLCGHRNKTVAKRGKRKHKPSRNMTDTSSVLARVAGRKKHKGDTPLTRVERSYFPTLPT